MKNHKLKEFRKKIETAAELFGVKNPENLTDEQVKEIFVSVERRLKNHENKDKKKPLHINPKIKKGVMAKDKISQNLDEIHSSTGKEGDFIDVVEEWTLKNSEKKELGIPTTKVKVEVPVSVYSAKDVVCPQLEEKQLQLLQDVYTVFENTPNMEEEEGVGMFRQRSMSLGGLYRVRKNKNATSEELKDFRNLIRDTQHRITIETKNLKRHGKEVTEVLDTRLLNTSFGKYTDKAGNEIEVVIFNEYPPMLRYAKQRGQLLTRPIENFKVKGLRYSDNNKRLQDEIFLSVTSRGKRNYNKTLKNYEFSDEKILEIYGTGRTNLPRVKKAVEKILAHYILHGEITDWEYGKTRKAFLVKK